MPMTMATTGASEQAYSLWHPITLSGQRCKSTPVQQSMGQADECSEETAGPALDRQKKPLVAPCLGLPAGMARRL